LGEFHDPFLNVSDETLCNRAASGDRAAEESLVLRYARLVRILARPYFLAGGDSEDLIQEGMVGLLKAVREYDPSKNASFRTYAELCIRSRLYSAIRTAAQDKHVPLNRYIPFEHPQLQELTDRAVAQAFSKADDPEALLLQKEAHGELMDLIEASLSKLERAVLELYLQGLSYSKIATEADCSVKAVDNAVQRIRRKLTRQ
jgi:RNA polymerase sporulation-specific sigma factor